MRPGRPAHRGPGTAGPERTRLAPRRRRSGERGILVEDRGLELAQVGPGSRPSSSEPLPGAPVGLEGVRLAAAAVEGDHELRREPLAQGMLGGQRLELARHVGVPAEPQVGLDAILDRSEAGLLEAGDLWLRERLVLEVRQRRSSPEPERVAELPGRRLGPVTGEVLAGLGHQALELARVELARSDAQDVARAPGQQHPVGHLAAPVLRERLAQLGDVDLHALGGGRGRPLAPELVDQPVAGDDLVRVEQENREQRLLLPATERDRLTLLDHLQGTEDRNSMTCLRPGWRTYHGHPARARPGASLDSGPVPAFKPAYLIHGDDHGRLTERRARLRALAEQESGPGGSRSSRATPALRGRPRSADRDDVRPRAALRHRRGRRALEGGRRRAPGARPRRPRRRPHRRVLRPGGEPPHRARGAAQGGREGGGRGRRRRERQAARPPEVVRRGGAAPGARARRPRRPRARAPRRRAPAAPAARAREARPRARSRRGGRRRRDRRAHRALGGAQVWSLADALVARDRAAALEIFLELREQGERLPGLLYWMVQRLRQALDVTSRLEAGESAAEVRKTLRMPSWAASELIAHAQRSDSERLRRAVERLADLEVDTRGGGTLSEDTAALRAIAAISGWSRDSSGGGSGSLASRAHIIRSRRSPAISAEERSRPSWPEPRALGDALRRHVLGLGPDLEPRDRLGSRTPTARAAGRRGSSRRGPAPRRRASTRPRRAGDR